MTDDDSEMDLLYEKALEAELGDCRHTTDKVRHTVYSGDLAFALQLHCVKPDTPPKGRCDMGTIPYYRFHIIGLNHDMAMYILTNMKDVFPLDICSINMSSGSYGSRRNGAMKELEALGIGHMGQWLTCCKDGTYTISIRHLLYKQCSSICKVLFAW